MKDTSLGQFSNPGSKLSVTTISNEHIAVPNPSSTKYATVEVPIGNDIPSTLPNPVASPTAPDKIYVNT